MVRRATPAEGGWARGFLIPLLSLGPYPPQIVRRVPSAGEGSGPVPGRCSDPTEAAPSRSAGATRTVAPRFELDRSGRAAPDARSPPAVAGGLLAYSAVRDGHPQPVITAVIPPGPVSKRSNETDSMTTIWLPGQVSVERGVTVKLPVV
jgi:hypothetical protein